MFFHCDQDTEYVGHYTVTFQNDFKLSLAFLYCKFLVSCQSKYILSHRYIYNKLI